MYIESIHRGYELVRPQCLRVCTSRTLTNPNPIQTPRGKDLCLPLPPPRLRPGGLLERGDGLARLKSDPKPILLLDCFQIPCWLHFHSDLGSILNSFSRPNRPKFGLRCPSKRYLLQKRGFSQNSYKTNEIS